MSIDRRLSELESRLTSIETHLGIGTHRHPPESVPDSSEPPQRQTTSSDSPSSESAQTPTFQVSPERGVEILSVTGILG